MSSRRVHPNPRRHPGRPPVQRICALAVKDDAVLEFKIPTDGPTARADGLWIFFFAQPPGQAPIETTIPFGTGIRLYGDADARRLWRQTA